MKLKIVFVYKAERPFSLDSPPLVERACVMAPGPIVEAPDLFPEGGTKSRPRDLSLGAAREANERENILRALESHGWRMAETANALGVSRKTLWQKLKRMDIQRP